MITINKKLFNKINVILYKHVPPHIDDKPFLFWSENK